MLCQKVVNYEGLGNNTQLLTRIKKNKADSNIMLNMYMYIILNNKIHDLGLTQ